MALRDDAATAIAEITHKAVMEHLRRERAGASATMNGALEGVDYEIADAIIPLVIARERERCANTAELMWTGSPD